MSLSPNSAAAVVVHYNSAHTLPATIRDLSARLPADRIIIVDNSRNLISSDWVGLAKIIAPDGNLGYGAAVNVGFKFLAEGFPDVDEVLVCTHETRFTEASLSGLFEEAASLPAGHLVAPELVTRTQAGDEAIWSQGGTLSWPFLYPKHIRKTNAPPRRKRVLWVDGAAFVMDVAAWASIGGVPEDFFIYLEDVALGFRCRSLGIPIYVIPRLKVEQEANGPTRARAVRNRLILATRYMSLRQRIVVLSEFVARTALLTVSPRAADRARAAESRKIARDLIDERKHV